MNEYRQNNNNTDAVDIRPDVGPVKQLVEVFDDFYKFTCPYCGIGVVVMKNELACRIFRCGLLKSNGTQIPPHANKKDCDKLRETDSVYGCARPFIIRDEYVEPCDYI